MNSLSDLDSYLSSIDSFLEDISILYYAQDIHNDSAYAAKGKYDHFKSEFDLYKFFLDQVDINQIKNQLNTICQNLSRLNSKEYSSEKDHSELVSNTINTIETLPDINKKKFVYKAEIPIERFSHLQNNLEFTNIEFPDSDIVNNIKVYSEEELIEYKKILIDLHNAYLPMSTPNASLFIKAHNFFKKLKEKNELSSVNDKLNYAKETLIKVRTETGKISNNELALSFKTEADSLLCKIRMYTALIFLIFAIIITSLIIFITSSKTGAEYKFPSDIHFYYFYISLLFIITGFLTFIIKERIRLVNHYQYCNISHLEIRALSTYTAEIDDKIKIDDLKIRLAERYFKGPNSNSENSSDLNNPSLISSRLSEISKAIQDVKSTIK